VTTDQMREALYWIDLAQHALFHARRSLRASKSLPPGKLLQARDIARDVWHNVHSTLLATDEVRADYKRAGLTLVTPKELDALRERALRFMTPMEERNNE
jgi:hypothetical protein